MRILILRNFNMFSEQGASANRWRTLAEGLARLDVEICLAITSGYRSAGEKRQFGKRGKINGTITYHYLSGRNHHSYLPARINQYLLAGLNIIPLRKKLKRIIHAFNPGYLLLGPGMEVLKVVAGMMSSGEQGFQLVMELNEYEDLGGMHLSNPLQQARKKAYNHLLRARIFPLLDRCLVMTDILLEHYRSVPGLKPGVAFLKVPMTVDLERFSTRWPECDYRKPYIAYCGTSSFAKDGVDILIRSFAAISNQYPGLNLYLATYWHADGPRMLELIRETGLGKRIIYLGPLDREEIPPFLQHASVLALPRPDSKQARGGFPTKLGEYLATGNPVCVTRVGEIPGYLHHDESAFMAEAGSVDSFIAALSCALGDEVHAARVGKRGRAVAETCFSMDVQAKRIYDFLKA